MDIDRAQVLVRRALVDGLPGREVGQVEVFEDPAAVSVWARAHAMVASRGVGGKLGDQATLLVGDRQIQQRLTQRLYERLVAVESRERSLTTMMSSESSG